MPSPFRSWPSRSIPCLAALLALAGCAHTPGPGDVARAYAQALEEDRLADAYALTSGTPEGQPAFLTHYKDAGVRQARVAEVRAALPELQARAPALVLRPAPEAPKGWRVLEEQPADAPREALSGFLGAVETGHWVSAWGLLSEPLRARYTPERLHADYEREPLAAERVRRARLAVKGPVRVTDGTAEFPLGPERAVRLVREAGEYRVDALE